MNEECEHYPCGWCGRCHEKGCEAYRISCQSVVTTNLTRLEVAALLEAIAFRLDWDNGSDNLAGLDTAKDKLSSAIKKAKS